MHTVASRWAAFFCNVGARTHGRCSPRICSALVRQHIANFTSRNHSGKQRRGWRRINWPFLITRTHNDAFYAPLAINTAACRNVHKKKGPCNPELFFWDTKSTQRWSVSQHRRANLWLFLVNDKPPYNRQLCVRGFFFPLLVSSLSPLISFPFRFSKKSGKVVLPSSCGVFCACFLWPEKIVSGRGRPLRSGGGGGGGGGGGTRVHAAAAAVERAGSYATVRGCGR